MSIILFDDQHRNNLFPLTYTRPVSEIRVGILTIADKWRMHLSTELSYLTDDYLQHKFPLRYFSTNFLINSAICPDERLLDAFHALNEGEAIFSGDLLIMLRLAESDARSFKLEHLSLYKRIEYTSDLIRIEYPENIFSYNDIELNKDFRLLTKGRQSAKLSSTNTILGEDIFVEEGVDAECSTFNTKTGPIYLGKGAMVMEGCHIRGSFSMGEDSILKMGAKIYGKTSIGPHSKIGGEVNNSVVFANSSKGHEGYLGNSVLGEWCNIGADSNNSNMKNNYAEVRLWSYPKEGFRRTGLQFCGLIMADHAKCGINTMFNTGTVVGVGANVFGAGFPRNFVPDFAWGGSHGFEVYAINKMFDTTSKVFQRRNVEFTDIEKSILSRVFELTEQYRRY